MSRSALPYRPCVGVAVFNPQGLVFVGRRKGMAEDAPFAWQMPQGGIDEGEDPMDAAHRELFEETGISTVTPVAEASDWLNYDLPTGTKKKWQDRYRGQTQKWFAFRFGGDDSEVRLDLHGKPEFDTWRWIPLAETPSLVVPFKRPVYEQIVEEFAGFAAS